MKHNILKYLFAAIAAAFTLTAAQASTPARFHCEKDTLKINNILESLKKETPQERIVEVVQKLVKTPGNNMERVKADTLGTMEINICDFDNLGFLNSVLSLATAAGEDNADWHTFLREFENISYHNGTAGDFTSKLFFPMLWIQDNKLRRNIVEVTEDLGVTARIREKTINDVSHHREDYGVLQDSATYEAVRLIEMGYCSHRLPYLDNNAFTKKEVKANLRNGDIVMLLSTDPGVDSKDMGFIIKTPEDIYFCHISPKDKIVITEVQPLDKYIKVNTRRIAGGRIFRLNK